jgi:hypothetical protein
MQYYGRFYPSALYPLLARVNAYLVRWIRNQYRRYDATRAARQQAHGDCWTIRCSSRRSRRSSTRGGAAPPH